MTQERQLRILLVDDEPQVAAALVRQLRRRGFHVETADSAEDALFRFADGAGWDVVISDFRMPHVNGIELLTAVSLRAPQVVRVLLSGYFDGETFEPKPDGVLDAFLRKPWKIEELLEAISSAQSKRALSKGTATSEFR